MALENLEDAGEEDNGTVILSLTGNDAKWRKREKRKGKEGNLEEKAREWVEFGKAEQ